MNGKTHQIHIKEQENSIQDFLNTACLPTSSESTNSCLTVPTSSIAHTADTGTAHTTSNSADHEDQSSLHHLSTMSKKVTDAEIFWALNCVNSHVSASSNVGINALFKRMFNDSEIVSLYSMSESKYRYLTTFGLGPHFSKLLLEKVKASVAHCILFDESLNNELQNKQLDVHVRFWSENTLRVESRYFNSLFIGHGRANDILDHYSEATRDLDAA